jgi:hypothetical protein
MKLALALVLGSACTTSSPLVETGPQIEITADPGNVSDGPLFRITLTTWNHLAVLADAAESGELVVTLDGETLPLEPASRSYHDGQDAYVAAYSSGSSRSRTDPPTSSTVSVTDQETTWTATIAGLFTNDLQPTGPIAANQPATLIWPSAATSGPYSAIEWACIDVATRGAACHGEDVADPGIEIMKQYVLVDLPGDPGDGVVITGSRRADAACSDDGYFIVSILDRWSANFE